ncbi:hypothetical protein ACM66B_001590 [Microbotryomycetes sp. NB124-2]
MRTDMKTIWVSTIIAATAASTTGRHGSSQCVRTSSKWSLNSWQLRTLPTRFNTRHGNARTVPNHEPNKHENATSSTQGKGLNGAKEAVTIPMKRQDGMSSDEDLPSLDE